MINKVTSKYLWIIPLILLVGIILFSSTSCRKERSMTLTVVAKLLADTNIVVPGAKVVLLKDDIRVEGYTDGRGEFRHSFNLQVQLDITVSNDSLKGLGKVNLGTHGEDVEKSIFLFP
ncbi:MAG: hypothetical protein JXR34_10840 [Bacteroidales bacterium]|nr:hypothetical protein [Bacteroidales bacterium]